MWMTQIPDYQRCSDADPRDQQTRFWNFQSGSEYSPRYKANQTRRLHAHVCAARAHTHAHLPHNALRFHRAHAFALRTRRRAPAFCTRVAHTACCCVAPDVSSPDVIHSSRRQLLQPVIIIVSFSQCDLCYHIPLLRFTSHYARTRSIIPG